ncbi:MAG: hypothetical protein K2Z81_06450, partial [Cyanobacteria bacterium]|nr:hypothetical protein [Cyanobacteriota bacterium]
IVFPEAEITGDEQSIHEVSRSFTHILLEAQEDIAKVESEQSIWILPVGVSYRLETNLEASVSKTLKNIERHLSISHDPHADTKTRATSAVDAVLQSLSQNYKCMLAKEQPQHQQVLLLAQHVCERICKYVGAEHEQKVSTEQLLYSVRNDVVEQLDANRVRSPYQQKLWCDASKIYEEFLQDLDRVERLMILQRVLKRPTPIQVCRILDFLEAETFGRMTKKGRQRASVFIGKPFQVLPHLELYKSCKNSAIDELSVCIHNQLQSALDNAHRK